MTCPHALNPKTCVEEKSRRHRHILPFQSVECDYCPHAYANGLAAPRPEGISLHRFENVWKIDPKDFDGEPLPYKPETRGRNQRKQCPKGHNEWGTRKQDGKTFRYCLACNRERVARQRGKAPKAKHMDYRRAGCANTG